MLEASTPLASVETVVDTEHRSAHQIPSVAIVGPGLVGATIAYALLAARAAAEIVLIGRDGNRQVASSALFTGDRICLN
jgi:hypothetical protein